MSDADNPQADEPESQPDDLDIEVSDLRGRVQPGGSPTDSNGATPWYRQRVEVPRPLVVATLVAMLALILLVATPIGSALRAPVPQPTPTTGAIIQIVYPTAPPPTGTPYPSPTLIAPALGPVPTNCPPSAPLVDFAPNTIIPGVGGSGVWLVGFVGPGGNPVAGQRATEKIAGPQRIPSAYTYAGWPIWVEVLAGSDFAQTVTLTGRDLRTGYSLWFSPDSNKPDATAEAAPVVTIDFSASTPDIATSDAQWKTWFGIIYLPGAGCYTLQANWPGDGWVVNFAAGR